MNAKILIVDDQAMMLRLIGYPLEQEGYTILTAMTATEAFQKLHGEQPDLLILDILLPDMSGIDVCRRVRQELNLLDLPIIILSGQTELAAKVQGLEAGADEYVTKPVDPKEMVVRVRALLARTQRLRQAPAGQPGRPGRVVGVIGCKGGVGTTTLVANLAAGLAVSRYRTIALELRPYFGTLARHFRLPSGPTLSELVELTPQRITPQQVTPRLLSTHQGLQILVGPQQLKEYREIQPEQVEALLAALTQLAEVVVVDLPHLPSIANRAALRAAQIVIVVIEPEAGALAAAQALLELLRAWGIPPTSLRAVVVNRIQSALALPLPEIERALGCEVLGTIPGAPDLALSALNQGIPMVLSAASSLAAGVLLDISKRIGSTRPVGSRA